MPKEPQSLGSFEGWFVDVNGRSFRGPFDTERDAKIFCDYANSIVELAYRGFSKIPIVFEVKGHWTE